MKTKNGFSWDTLSAVISGQHLWKSQLLQKGWGQQIFLFALHVGEKKCFFAAISAFKRVFYCLPWPLKCCICLLLRMLVWDCLGYWRPSAVFFPSHCRCLCTRVKAKSRSAQGNRIPFSNVNHLIESTTHHMVNLSPLITARNSWHFLHFNTLKLPESGVKRDKIGVEGHWEYPQPH